MNMLKKGPELKLPDLKVPDFLVGLYYDLRERHLLPLVAILVVALVALPIFLRDSSSDPAPTTSDEGSSVAGISSAGARSSKLVVAKAAPGLRDYRRRLDRTPHDPFAPKGAQGSAKIEGTTASAPTESAPATSPEGAPETIESAPAAPAPPPAAPTPADEGQDEPASGEHLQYYSFAIDVRVVPASSGEGSSKPEPSVRRNLPELTMLPSRKEPALTFMGVTKDEKKALMLVSDKVTGLFGDAVCVVGSERCQLLRARTGAPGDRGLRR